MYTQAPSPVHPVQGITISESSQLSSVSQLERSHPASPLHLQIALAQSRDSANVVRNSEIAQTYCAISRMARNLEIGTQFWDSENAQRNLENVQRNLEIAQIPKLRRTYVPHYLQFSSQGS